MGQQLFGLMLACAGHLQVGMSIGQAIAVVDVIGHGGHCWMGQQLVGSTPTVTGCCPPAHASIGMGQMAGCAGSHFEGAGTHWLVQVWPLQFPAASHVQLESPAGQVHVVPGAPAGAADEPVVETVEPPVAPVVDPVTVPAAVAQPHPRHETLHTCPVGQSASELQLDFGGWQVQGPPHGSVPAHAIVSPGAQVGVVQPQVEGRFALDAAVVAPHGHW